MIKKLNDFRKNYVSNLKKVLKMVDWMDRLRVIEQKPTYCIRNWTELIFGHHMHTWIHARSWMSHGDWAIKNWSLYSSKKRKLRAWVDSRDTEVSVEFERVCTMGARWKAWWPWSTSCENSLPATIERQTAIVTEPSRMSTEADRTWWLSALQCCKGLAMRISMQFKGLQVRCPSI